VTATLVYDGDCAFCTSSVRWVTRLHLGADVVVAYQHADLEPLGLTEQQCADKLQLVLPTGTWSGHAAVGKLLLRSQWYWRPVGFLLRLPLGRRPPRQDAGRHPGVRPASGPAPQGVVTGVTLTH